MYRTVIAKPIDSLIFLPLGPPDPRQVPEMYQISIAKPIDSLVFLPFGLREGCQVSNESGGPD